VYSIHTHTHTYIYIYVHTYTYLYTSTHTHISLYIHIYIYIYSVQPSPFCTCRSFIGFQSWSRKMTVSAEVRLSPSPPTAVVSSIRSMLGSALNFSTNAPRFEPGKVEYTKGGGSPTVSTCVVILMSIYPRSVCPPPPPPFFLR